ncbi:unnamed protein product [Durusdinium trenchii]|uniref:Uncharacterized protein n=1 Tax=Durusdinium trenchii TaxID=1381693 RepID=A0ABP0PNL1_9DINO
MGKSGGHFYKTLTVGLAMPQHQQSHCRHRQNLNQRPRWSHGQANRKQSMRFSMSILWRPKYLDVCQGQLFSGCKKEDFRCCRAGLRASNPETVCGCTHGGYNPGKRVHHGAWSWQVGTPREIF